MMKEKNLKKRYIIFFSIIIGIVFFISIYGIKVLDFTYIDWLINKGDLSQHYFGWEFFRKSKWFFPIGLTEGIIYPNKVSVMYMDSIPLFAIFFKIFNFLLPKNFQYFGLFGLINIVLITYTSGLLLKKYASNYLELVLAMIFFTVSPVMLIRLYGHEALSSHWIILISLYILDNRNKILSLKNKCLIWSSLATLTVLIHIYFLPMILIVLLVFLILEYYKNKSMKENITILLVTLLSTLATMFFLGAFYGKSDFNNIFGIYSSNINTFINPTGFSKYISPMKTLTDTQAFEGFGYLGLGMIFLLFISIKKIFKHRNYYLKKGFIAIFLISCFYAINPVFSFYDLSLITLKYPSFIIKILAIFRANGRFIWLAYYIIMFIVFQEILKLKTKLKYFLLFISLLLQISDIRPLLHDRKENFGKNISYVSKLKSTFWNKLLLEKYNKLFFMDDYIVNSSEYLWDFIKYASDNNMKVNDINLARKSLEEIKKNRIKLISQVDKNAIYIFSPIENNISRDNGLFYYKIDNFIIGVSKDYPEYKKYDFGNFNIDSLSTTGEKDNNEIILRKDKIQYGPYIYLKKGIYGIIVKGTNLNKGNFEVNSNGEVIKIQNIRLDNNKVEYEVNLNKNYERVEFKILNNTNDEIRIKELNITPKLK